MATGRFGCMVGCPTNSAHVMQTPRHAMPRDVTLSPAGRQGAEDAEGGPPADYGDAVRVGDSVAMIEGWLPSPAQPSCRLIWHGRDSCARDRPRRLIGLRPPHFAALLAQPSPSLPPAPPTRAAPSPAGRSAASLRVHELVALLKALPRPLLIGFKQIAAPHDAKAQKQQQRSATLLPP